ncbi:MAG: CHASE2 domain-containing protein, partial [Pseudomonadota bacterium]
TDAYASTDTRQDLDGVVRRASAFVAQPYINENGERDELLLTAMPVAALTACAAENPNCVSFDPEATLFQAGGGSAFTLKLKRADGVSPPPTPLTSSLDFWMDFGALEAMGPAAAGEAPQGARTISAASIFQGDAAERARIRDRHVFIGLTRIGAIDQHTTPMSFEAGVPGVLIQALAADNLISGRALAEPAWARLAVTGFLIALGALALVRFLMTSAPALAALGFALIAAPLALSWAAFAIGGMVIGGATPAIGAFLAVSPILYGRIAAIRRELATARESQARDEERMDAARSIQLGSLPFQADYTDIGFETASICRPAQEVGGDFFELFELTDGRLFAAVGDVSGKGLEASLVTALSKSISGAVTDRVPGPLGDG